MILRSVILSLLFLGTFIIVTAQSVRECPDSQPCGKEEIEYRFSLINSDIPMDMNPTVYKYIRHTLHRSEKRSNNLIGLCEAYFPILDEMLEREGVPIALKYMCIAESFMNPNAISKAKAVGMWQFMPATGRMYGLQVDKQIDERYDFYKETVAAAHFLKDLHDRFDDWLLAIAAYNCGPGNVRKAIRKAGGGKKDFWQIRKYLPRETRNYVPKIIAEMYFMYFYSEYGLSPTMPDWHNMHVAVDEVHHDTNPEELADKHHITLGELYLFNPAMLKEGISYLELPYQAKIPAPYHHYELGIAQPYIPVVQYADHFPNNLGYPKPNMAPEKLAKFPTPERIEFAAEEHDPTVQMLEYSQVLSCRKEDWINYYNNIEEDQKSVFPVLGLFFFRQP